MESQPDSDSSPDTDEQWPDERPSAHGRGESVPTDPSHSADETEVAERSVGESQDSPLHSTEPFPEERVTELSRHFNKVLIAANPKSGAQNRTQLLERLRLRLEEDGWHVEIETDLKSLKQRIAAHQTQPEFDLVVAAGGDGTAAMLAAQIGRETPLALFPLGTENLLAKQFRIRAAPKATRNLLQTGKCLDVDVGLANDRVFLLHATVGFDAEVVRRLHAQRTGHIRHWSYLAPIFQSIQTYNYPEMRISTDLDRRPFRARWAFVFNLPAYAMNLPIVSDASGTDGQFDVCTFRGGSLRKGLSYLLGVILRQHRSWRDTHLERTAWVKIESDEEVPFQIDGDPGGTLPLTISFRQEPLRLVIPTAVIESRLNN